MYLSIIILIGTIVLLFGYIKFHIDLQFSPDERKWYEKIRFLFPLLVIPIFGAIYYFWNMYPDILIDRDSQTAPMETGAQLAWTIEGLLTPQSSPEPMTKFEEIGSKYGTFGDSYGSLNTLFTGFAFSGLIISIFIQLLELRQTRKELSGQKTALLGQQEEFQKQTQILENQQKIIDNQFKESQKQKFSKEFYSLIDNKNFLLNNISISTETHNLSGKSIFILYVNKFREIRKLYDKSIHDYDFFDDHWHAFTKSLFEQTDYQLIHYLSFYEMILTSTYNSDSITDYEKAYYFKIIKSFITIEERLILMWLGTFRLDFYEICNKHALLDGIYNKNLIDIGVDFFDRTAFGDSLNWDNAFKENEKQVTEE